MRARAFVVSLLVVASAVAVSVPGPAASAATGTLSVTPNTDLSGGDLVAIAGSGFAPSVDVGVCEGIVAGAPGIEDCGTTIGLFRTDENGAFSTQFAVHRFLTVGGQPVDCASPGAACSIGAAELDDIANTAVAVPLGFEPASANPRPDLIFKRHDTQQLLYNDQYFPNVPAAPQRAHSIASGGTWTYALVVQNDGDVADDLVLTTPHVPSAPFGLRVFVGYYDITAPVTGSGLVFHDVAPGQSFVVAIRFSADAGAHDAGVLASVKLSSGSAPELVDYAQLWVDAPTTVVS